MHLKKVGNHNHMRAAESPIVQVASRNGDDTSTVASNLETYRRLRFWFNISGAAVLSVTGIAKLWSSLGSSKYLAEIDPIVGISFGHLMQLAGSVEVLVSLVCLFSTRRTLATGLLSYISVSILVYRIGLYWLGWHRPCGCLGNLTDALHISPQIADNIMKFILAYLLIGSLGLLAFRWRIHRHQLWPRNEQASGEVEDSL